MINFRENINAPIGIFDSGLGGLSVTKEIIEFLPGESIIYLADSKNAPYGEKSKEEIIQFSIKNTELLLGLGCKLIVVACNTATTNAIKILRDKYDVAFIGIEPAIKPAALNTKTGKIGVLATRGTLASELFLSTSSKFNDVEFIEVEGKGLVTLIEAGKIEETKPLLKKYLLPMIEKGADKIVLGCTHYPFLIPLIKEIIPASVNIIDSGLAVAKQTKAVLQKQNHLSDKEEARYSFYTNNDLSVLKQFLKAHNIVGETSFKNF